MKDALSLMALVLALGHFVGHLVGHPAPTPLPEGEGIFALLPPGEGRA